MFAFPKNTRLEVLLEQPQSSASPWEQVGIMAERPSKCPGSSYTVPDTHRPGSSVPHTPDQRILQTQTAEHDKGHRLEECSSTARK
jgi:hypothetical protein